MTPSSEAAWLTLLVRWYCLSGLLACCSRICRVLPNITTSFPCFIDFLLRWSRNCSTLIMTSWGNSEQFHPAWIHPATVLTASYVFLSTGFSICVFLYYDTCLIGCLWWLIGGILSLIYPFIHFCVYRFPSVKSTLTNYLNILSTYLSLMDHINRNTDTYCFVWTVP